MPGADPVPVLILASGSPRRRDLLGRLGLAFDVRPADVDETPGAGESAHDLVRRLAVGKADAALAAAPEPDVVVLAADTVVVVDDEILGKPADAADAARMLRRLSGRSHRVLTGVAVAARSAARSAPASPAGPASEGAADDVALGPATSIQVEVEATVVTFRALSDDEIARYVATGEPLDKAGAYGIQGGAGGFVAAVDGDVLNVIGLGVTTTRRLLTQAGLPIP